MAAINFYNSLEKEKCQAFIWLPYDKSNEPYIKNPPKGDRIFRILNADISDTQYWSRKARGVLEAMFAVNVLSQIWLDMNQDTHCVS